MSTAPTPPAAPAVPLTPLMRWLLTNRFAVRVAIFVFAGACILYPLVQLLRFGFGSGVSLNWIYSAAMGFIALSVGAYDLTNESADEEAEAAKLKLELMVLGGLLGLATVAFGFILPFTAFREQLGGGLDSWRKRENRTAVVVPALLVIGGLGLMFLSVQLVRGMERQNQAVRRIVYGYNVLLTSLLLLAVLALPNVLAYAQPFSNFFGRPFDWTQTEINAISDQMRNYLTELNEPVKVYLITMPGDPIGTDMETLLANCRSINPKFSWETVSLRSPRVNSLMEKYSISSPQGALVVVGEEGEKAKPDFTLIKYTDLFERDPSMARRGAPVSYSFLGENALFTALVSMTEGKTVIYFATGHDELAPDDKMAIPGMPPQQRGGLSQLRSRLTERKSVEVKTLALDRTATKVPDDASVVVIARPMKPYQPGELKVLREYLSRQAQTEPVKDGAAGRTVEKVTAGKLIVLLDPVTQKDGATTTLLPTGLEPLLAEYGVKAGQDRVLIVNPNLENPANLITMANPATANPIAKAFQSPPGRLRPFFFPNARSIEPLDAKGGPTRSVEKLFIAPEGFGVVVETNFNINPDDLRAALLKDESRFEKRLSKTDVSIAVAVSDRSMPPGMPPDAAHAGVSKESPRMVVFGSSGWLTDEGLQEGGRGTVRMDLFNSCLSWLREKSSIGTTITGKKRKEYENTIPNTDLNRVAFLPLGLLVLGVVVLGLGVWVVRRR